MYTTGVLFESIPDIYLGVVWSEMKFILRIKMNKNKNKQKNGVPRQLFSSEYWMIVSDVESVLFQTRLEMDLDNNLLASVSNKWFSVLS